MTFITPSFWLAIILLLVLFYLIKRPEQKTWFLLLTSLIFYWIWGREYIIVLVISILGTYACGVCMQAKKGQRLGKAAFYLGLLLNIGLLIGLKYLRFFAEIANTVWALQTYFPGIDLSTVPVINVSGLSFFTLMNISYLLDAQNGVILPERNPKKMFLFVSYFPKLLSGPIERVSKFFPQLEMPFEFDYQLVTNGLKRITWGLFKKLVIANRLALLVNIVYDHVADYSGLNIILATYLFAFQIYCDFSGYSDIAIGISQLFGIQLMDNFKQPYFANSLSDFWSRWHISLSNWLRDYIFFPFRRSMLRKFHSMRNLNAFLSVMVTMLISGLWHGAAWTFVIWGGLHGLFSFIETINAQRIAKWQEKLDSIFLGAGNLMKIGFTFNLVCFAWIFFRADSLSNAMTLISKIVVPATSWFITPHELFVSLLLIGILLAVDFYQYHSSSLLDLSKSPALIRWAIYSLSAVAILIFAVYETGQDFIYFRF